MLHWAWGIAKRRPARTLILCGLALMGAVAIHLELLERAGSADRSLRTSDAKILAVFGDAVFALSAVAMVAWGLWRIAHDRQ